MDAVYQLRKVKVKPPSESEAGKTSYNTVAEKSPGSEAVD